MTTEDENRLLRFFENAKITNAERMKILSCRKFVEIFLATLEGYRTTELELKAARDVLAPIPSGEATNKVVSVAQIHPATGKVVAKFQSISDAARAIGRHHCVISDTISGRINHGGGYKWRKIRRHKKCKHCGELKVADKGFRLTPRAKGLYASKCFECEPKVHKIGRVIRALIKKENHVRSYAKNVTLIVDGVSDFIKPMKFQDAAIKIGRNKMSKSLLQDTIELSDTEVSGLAMEVTSAISEYIFEGKYQEVMNAVFEHLKAAQK